jgi:hypothetical protein
MTMFLNSLRLAIRSTLANKMRSFLTMLGIINRRDERYRFWSHCAEHDQLITSAISSWSDLLTVTITDEDVTLSATTTCR